MTFKTNMKTLALLAGLALGSISLAACGDDGESTPPDNNNDKDSGTPKAGRGGTGGGAGSDGGGIEDSGPQAGSRADSGTNDAGTPDGGTDASTPTCPEDPETNEEFLNRCTDSQCEPFDNQARIEHPDYVEGEPLPDDYP